jgi:hypothetical protein
MKRRSFARLARPTPACRAVAQSAKAGRRTFVAAASKNMNARAEKIVRLPKRGQTTRPAFLKGKPRSPGENALRAQNRRKGAEKGGKVWKRAEKCRKKIKKQLGSAKPPNKKKPCTQF